MAPIVPSGSRLKRGNVCPSTEGEMLIKEEIKEEIEDDICAVVQRELFSEANDQQHVELQPESDNSYLAGNLVHVTIKEEGEEVIILNPPTTSNPSTKPNPYQCRLCLATFSDSQKTLEHIRDHGNGKSHPCLTCHQAFYSVTELRHHQQQLQHQQAPVPSPEAQTERPYSCTICRRTFRLLGHLSNHQLTHTKYEQTKKTAKDQSTEPPKPSPAVFLCEICCKAFPNQEHLIAHQKSHLEHLHSTSSCTLCGELLPSESDLNEHLIVHRKANLARETIKEKEETTGTSSSPTKPNPFQCRLCLASFSDSRTTLAHIRSHSTYPKTVKSPDHPATHQTLDKSTETSPNLPKKVPLPKPSPAAVICEVCFKTFPNQEHLIAHQKSHLDLHSRSSCTLCGEVFTSENDLMEHLVVHRSSRHPKVPFYTRPIARPPRKPRPKPEKPPEPSIYQCPHCSRVYANKKTRSVHLREKHPPPGTERKPKLKRFFPCDLCQQEKGSSLNFSSSSSLANHKLSIHSGKREHKCTLCDYDCARSDSMTKHMRKHAGEKSFKPIPCTLCPRIFTMRSRLDSHLKDDHEGKEQWKCSLCGKLYGTKGGLKRHSTWEHQGGTEPESGSEQDDDDETEEEEEED